MYCQAKPRGTDAFVIHLRVCEARKEFYAKYGMSKRQAKAKGLLNNKGDL